jgi:hypothetical protein
MLKDQTIRDALAMAPEGMGGSDAGTGGQQGRELDPEGLE